MTIAIGFTCADGLLLCADTQLTVSGVTKLHGSKIFREEHPNGVKSAIAIAGTVSYARMAMQHVEQRLADIPDDSATMRKIREVIEEEMRGMHQDYIYIHPDRYTLALSIKLIVAAWSPPENRAAIFWTEDATVNELRGYQAVGTGDALAHYVIKEGAYAPTMKEAEVRPLAYSAIAKAKDYADGCGGFTETIFLSKTGTLGARERHPAT